MGRNGVAVQQFENCQEVSDARARGCTSINQPHNHLNLVHYSISIQSVKKQATLFRRATARGCIFGASGRARLRV